jgi:hypothetical protein
VPSAAEIRYLLARLLLPSRAAAPFILAWSLWRRQHQAQAATAHYRRHQTQL